MPQANLHAQLTGERNALERSLPFGSEGQQEWIWAGRFPQLGQVPGSGIQH